MTEAEMQDRIDKAKADCVAALAAQNEIAGDAIGALKAALDEMRMERDALRFKLDELTR